MEEKKYIVVCMYPDEYDTDVFDTLEEADKDARRKWFYLTCGNPHGYPIDKMPSVYVAPITRDELNGSAIDEETGAIDWCDWRDFSQISDGSVFNSDVEKAREYAYRHEATPPFGED